MKAIHALIYVLIILMGISYTDISHAYGLRTGFGKVTLEDIPSGQAYSMREDAKFPLKLTNKGDNEMQLQIDILIPQEGDIQEGYEPIPDTDWIKLEKDFFLIEGKGTVETDVVIEIPDKEEYAGRKFHVFIWSHTVGESLGIGIKSKLLFSVKGREEE